MNKKWIALGLMLASQVMAGPVTYYGELKVSGSKIIGSKTNQPAQVRGVSLGWSNSGWESADFFNANTVNRMVDGWKAEVIRAPLGYSEGGGYSSDASNLTRVKAVIDAAIAKDVYVIIDWHSHHGENETQAAKNFFSSMAQTYGNKDHVIFEVYNEPIYTDWSSIKTYATEIITEIRKYSNNLVLVGTPYWSQNVDVAADNKLSDANTAYVAHFYAYTHPLNNAPNSVNTRSFKQKILYAMSKNCAVFVTEYGTTHSDGGSAGANYDTHSDANTNGWLYFLNQNNISSVAWNVNDKYEASAFFGTGSAFDQNNASNWTNTSKMTESGRYIFNMLKAYADTITWITGPKPSSSSTSISSSSAVQTTQSLVDDLEDGNGISIWGGKWSTYNDAAKGALSIVDPAPLTTFMAASSTNGTAYNAKMTFTLNKSTATVVPYVGMTLVVQESGLAWDLSACTDITYKYKGYAHSFRFETSETDIDGNHYRLDAMQSDSWVTQKVDFNQMMQGNGQYVDLNKAHAMRFSWHIEGFSGSTGTLEVDDIRCNGVTILPYVPILTRFVDLGWTTQWNANSQSLLIQVQKPTQMTVTVLDMLGRIQTVPVLNQSLAGTHSVSLQGLGRGTHLVKIQSGSRQMTRVVQIQ